MTSRNASCLHGTKCRPFSEEEWVGRVYLSVTALVGTFPGKRFSRGSSGEKGAEEKRMYAQVCLDVTLPGKSS